MNESEVSHLTKKLSDAEREYRANRRREDKQRQALYQKILDAEVFTISDVAKIFGKKTSTIRAWENEGLIPKVAKYDDGSGQEYRAMRKYTRAELYEVIKNVLNHDWQRNCIDREALTKIMKYIGTLVDIESTKRGRSNGKT